MLSRRSAADADPLPHSGFVLRSMPNASIGCAALWCVPESNSYAEFTGSSLNFTRKPASLSNICKTPRASWRTGDAYMDWLTSGGQGTIGVATIVFGLFLVWTLRSKAPNKPIPALGIALLPVSVLFVFVVGFALILRAFGVV